MGKVKVHHTNFDCYDAFATGWGISYKTGMFGGDKKNIFGSDIERIEAATEQSVKRIGSATGWGIVGGALAGPVGLVAGALLGGNGRETTFTLETSDGRTMIGTVATHTFNALVHEKLRFDEIKRPLRELQDEMQASKQRQDDLESEYHSILLDEAAKEGRPVHLIDFEKDDKIGRVLFEDDYRAWKERTGEIEELRAYAKLTKYVIPEGKTL